MICKNCGKENIENAKFCSACGSLLSDEFKICPKCRVQNSKDAKFCKSCGALLDDKRVCPSCGLENHKEAKYCKSCGAPLHKRKIGNIVHLIINIISLSLCSFIILYCFAATFTSFMVPKGFESFGLVINLDISKYNLFQVIEDISNIDSNPIATNLGAYGKAACIVPDVIALIGILTAMIGCGIVVILAIVKAVRNGVNRKLPNLERLSILATGILLAGLLIVSMNHINLSVASIEGKVDIGYTYGAVVLSAVCIGIIWQFVCGIVQFVFRCIEEPNVVEIRSGIFKTVEIGLIVILLFNVVINFANLSLNDEEIILEIQSSSFAYFSYAYSLAGWSNMQNKELSGDLVQSLVMSVIMITFMIVFVVMSLIFFIRRGTKEKEGTPKASLCCGIIFMVIAVVFLTLSCIAAPMILKTTSVFDSSIEGAGISEILKSTVSSNVIIFVVFACVLLTIEIVWKALDSKNSDPECIKNL